MASEATSAKHIVKGRSSPDLSGKAAMRAILSTLLRVVIPFLPAALVLGFIWVSFDTAITNFMPHYDVDQFIYWHEMATYASNGFRGGHYGVNELIAPFKGFGPHGIGIVMVYGCLYGLMPWLGYAAIPVFNVSLLTIALAAYVWCARPGLGKAVAVCLAVALYPPLFMYLPTCFQDGFQCAAGIILAIFFIRLINNRDDPHQLMFQLSTGVFLLLLCFVRYTWAVCFVPYFYILLSDRHWRIPLAFTLALATSLAVVWLFSLFVPAWYSSPQSGVHVSGTLPSEMMAFMLKRATGNLRSLFDYINNRAAAAIISGGLAFSLLGMAFAWRQASWKRGEVSPGAVVFLLIAMNMVVLLAVFILAWTGSGSHLMRLLSANYLFCFIVTFHIFPRRVFHPFVAYNATLLPLYLGIFQVYHLPGYINSEARRQVQVFSQQVSPYLLPNDATNAWDKTIFVNIPELGIAYLGIPAGFGIQTTVSKSKDVPLLSRYALATSRPASTGERQWTPLTETVIGTLYVNSLLNKGDLP